MLAKFNLKIGKDTFELQFEVKNEKEFFDQVSFYSNLPRTAPGGSDDLKLVSRSTKKGKYYSLISDTEKMEFKLGQNTVEKGNGLYPKGWHPAYQADEEENEAQQSAPVVGAPAVAPAPVAAAPAVAAPAAARPAVTMPAKVQTAVAAPKPAAVVTPAATPAPAAAAAPAPVANPVVNKMAADVLSRFKVNKPS